MNKRDKSDINTFLQMRPGLIYFYSGIDYAMSIVMLNLESSMLLSKHNMKNCGYEI